MTRCAVCGTETFAYTCNHCGKKHCSDHRLPEKHGCDGLARRSTSSHTLTGAGPSTTESARVLGWIFLPFWLLWMALKLLFRAASALLARPIVAVALVIGVLILVPAAPANVASVVGDVVPVGDYVAGNDTLSGPESASPRATRETTVEPAPDTQGPKSSTATTDAFERDVARAVHAAVNGVRAEMGVGRLQYDSRLATIANGHSETMASEGYIYHRGVDGSMEDRYERYGYDCRVPVSSNRYLTGAENVAQAWYRTSIIGGGYYDSPEELADGIVDQWLNSEGHRENLLRSAWRREGIGVEIVREDGNLAVYVTQNFC